MIILEHHTAAILRDYLSEVGNNNNLLTFTKIWIYKSKIAIAEWPAKIPDVNPIEYLWDELKRRIRTIDPVPEF